MDFWFGFLRKICLVGCLWGLCFFVGVFVGGGGVLVCCVFLLIKNFVC